MITYVQKFCKFNSFLTIIKHYYDNVIAKIYFHFIKILKRIPSKYLIVLSPHSLPKYLRLLTRKNIKAGETVKTFNLEEKGKHHCVQGRTVGGGRTISLGKIGCDSDSQTWMITIVT